MNGGLCQSEGLRESPITKIISCTHCLEKPNAGNLNTFVTLVLKKMFKCRDAGKSKRHCKVERWNLDVQSCL